MAVKRTPPFFFPWPSVWDTCNYCHPERSPGHAIFHMTLTQQRPGNATIFSTPLCPECATRLRNALTHMLRVTGVSKSKRLAKSWVEKSAAEERAKERRKRANGRTRKPSKS